MNAIRRIECPPVLASSRAPAGAGVREARKRGAGRQRHALGCRGEADPAGKLRPDIGGAAGGCRSWSRLVTVRLLSLRHVTCYAAHSRGARRADPFTIIFHYFVWETYLPINRSAMASSCGGTSMPMVRAVCKLITSANLVG